MIALIELLEEKIEALQNYKNAYTLEEIKNNDGKYPEGAKHILKIYKDYNNKYNIPAKHIRQIFIEYQPLSRCIDDMLLQIIHLRSEYMKLYKEFNRQKETIDTLRAALKKKKNHIIQ